jgi:ABC-type multidrug transport system fused ATPase/permease subunit
MMKNTKPSIVKKPLLAWVFRGNQKLKLILLFTVVVAVIIRVAPLELQKRIINQAIGLKAFELLLIYCGFYLVAVVIAGGLKYLIAYLQTVIGQRALTDMRKELYRYVLSLPLSFFRKTQPGMVVQTFASELATAGDFIGMAVAVPLVSVLSLIAFTAYLLWLNPLLAMVSFSIYPFSLFVLPALQRRANKANKKRVDAARDLSGKIAEAVSGIHEIQGNAAHHIESRKFDLIADRIQKIRIIWNLYRQGIKVSSNFFSNISPLIIFLLGGYLTIRGELGLGALVAFLSAQEKLFDPWRELIDVYQSYQEAAVTYRRTMQYFDVAPEFAVDPENRQPYNLEGNIEVKNLSFNTDEGVHLLSNASLTLAAGEQIALIGFSGSGKSTLANCIAQLIKYTGGHVLIDNRQVADLTKRDVAWNVGLVSQNPFIFDGTIEENLLYGCVSKMAPDPLPDLDQMIETIQQTGLFPDVLRFGLNSMLDNKAHAKLAPNLIRIRKKLGRRLNVPMAEHIEFFDKEKYQDYSTVAKNLTFGSANQIAFRENNLSKNEYFLKFLEDIDLMSPLMIMGSKLCRKTVALLAGLPPSEMFYEQSPLSPDELETYDLLSEQLKQMNWRLLNPHDQQLLLELALRFISGKHKMIVLPDDLKRQILKARMRFKQKIPNDFPGAFGFYRKSDYLFSQTILNNLIFGKIKSDAPQIQDIINEQIIQLLIEENLLEAVLKIGMQFQVGTRGDRLSGGQQQKLAIARAFLKNPKILIMDEATSALDNRSQARIQQVLDSRWKGRASLIAVAHRLDIIKHFDKVAVMKAGKIAELGPYDELMAQKGLLYELVTGKR